MGFGFQVPVSGKEIPRGWFAALVRFVNSLLLRGDGRYFAVTHTTEGTTIKPSPALIQALERSGGAAPSAGGGTTYGIQATISGTTASVTLVPGSTVTSLSLVPTAPVTLTAGTSGELIIGATVSSSGGLPGPQYDGWSAYYEPGVYYEFQTDGWVYGEVDIDYNYTHSNPDASTTAMLRFWKPRTAPTPDSNHTFNLLVYPSFTALQTMFEVNDPDFGSYHAVFCFPVPAGYRFAFEADDSNHNGLFNWTVTTYPDFQPAVTT